MTTIISYNVNGIRSAAKKGLLDWVAQVQPDVLCFQETKAQPGDLAPELLTPAGYYANYFSAEKKGYSGVAIWSKQQPDRVEQGMGIAQYDSEGRVLRADFGDLTVLSVYFPSGTSGDDRQAIKEAFLADFLVYAQELARTRPRLVIAGDYNIAHTAIDIHDPIRNAKSTGFLPHERAWMDTFFAAGFRDSFRLIHPQVRDRYSWWTLRANARPNNKGWRIDYLSLSEALAPACTDADILHDVVHSDHCPVLVRLA